MNNIVPELETAAVDILPLIIYIPDIKGVRVLITAQSVLIKSTVEFTIFETSVKTKIEIQSVEHSSNALFKLRLSNPSLIKFKIDETIIKARIQEKDFKMLGKFIKSRFMIISIKSS